MIFILGLMYLTLSVSLPKKRKKEKFAVGLDLVKALDNALVDKFYNL